MFNHYPAHNADMRGLRPHWLRTALLLIFVVLIFWLPRPSLPAPRDQVEPLADELMPTDIAQPAPLVGELTPSGPVLIYEAIDRANEAFRAARAQADLVPLQGIATGGWLGYERDQIEKLRSSGTTQRWILLSSSRAEPVLQGTQATVCSTEYWQLDTINANGNTIETISDDYTQQYVLQFVDDTWRVSEIIYDASQCQF
jgi:hypothetical protein